MILLNGVCHVRTKVSARMEDVSCGRDIAIALHAASATTLENRQSNSSWVEGVAREVCCLVEQMELSPRLNIYAA
jgi:hypothetical protein